MTEKPSPRLRTVEKIKPPFPLNEFSKDFGIKLGRQIIYLLATKGQPVIEGPEWERIFAECVGAEWKPSNVGLDDVILDTCAWGAKTVKAAKPSTQKKVRLISGRNSPTYSFGDSEITNVEPNILGGKILDIWNERVSAVRKKHKHVRTVVLIKSKTLEEVAVFEFDTIRYDPELYQWAWNKKNNLEGFEKASDIHCFTWQPHGSQFTIIENVPDEVLIVKIRTPVALDRDSFLQTIGFSDDWVEVIRKK